MALIWWDGMLDQIRQRCADGRIRMRDLTLSENLKLFFRHVGQSHIEAVLQKTDNIHGETPVHSKASLDKERAL
jgi:hypothetical protein